MQSRQLVLISGIPGTGKSSFAQWLQVNHGFVHYDVDAENGQLPSVEWILQQNRLVVDWGFPANEPSLSVCTSRIQSWIAGGVNHWWFDGDRAAALRSFLSRRTVSREAWDIQLGGITQNWPRIEALFPPKRRLSVISVIDADLTYLPNQEIFATIFSEDA
jgi:hypothetical protein